MHSLEILDLSRNTIKSFPEEPGSLVSLQVRLVHREREREPRLNQDSKILSVSRNRISRLPTYLSTFHRLTILKLDHNPIQWPPEQVWNSTQDLDEPQTMHSWLSGLKSWLGNAEDGTPRKNISESLFLSARYVQRWGSGWIYHESSVCSAPASSPPFDSIGFNHSRTYSSDSNTSLHSDSFPLAESSPIWKQNGDLMPDELALASEIDENSPLSVYDDSPSATSQHYRNFSYSVGHESPRSSGLSMKKSLPDLRTIRRAAATSEQQGSQSNRDPSSQTTPRSAVGNLSPQARSGPPNRLPNRPFETDPLHVMAVERNSYFKRLSTHLAGPSTSNTPPYLLSVVDAVRGIYFAIHQVYEQVEHYTIWTFDERISGLLRKLLDPARVYMSQLIQSLDRFDAAALSNQPMPIPPLFRAVIESCKDNISVCSKVIAALQLQLKVLSGLDDVRFTRSLVLMLYGSIGEISHSWKAIQPHIKKVKLLLGDRRATPLQSRSNSDASASAFDLIKKRQPGGRPFRNTSVRRHAGSFSVEDLELGRSMHEVPPIAEIMGMGPGDNSFPGYEHTPLPPDPNQSISQPFGLEDSPVLPKEKPLPPLDHNVSEPSRPSPQAAPAFRPAAKKSQHHLELPGDSSRFVDNDLLVTLTNTVDDAHILWLMVEDVLGHLDEPGNALRDALDVAVKITVILSGTIASIHSNPSGVNDKGLFENALQFIKARR